MSYHPAIGRFLERDPIGYDDGLNPYEADRSNPNSFTDPMGTAAEPTTTVSPQPIGIRPGVKTLTPPPRGLRYGIPLPVALDEMGVQGEVRKIFDDLTRDGCRGLTKAMLWDAWDQFMRAGPGAPRMPTRGAKGAYFLDLIDAIAYDCGDCKRKSIYAIQGQWMEKEPPKPIQGQKSRVLKNPVSEGGGAFNYSVMQRDGSWVYMDMGIREGEDPNWQKVYISWELPDMGETAPATVYVVKCVEVEAK